MGYNPQESLQNIINTMGTLLGVHPIVPWYSRDPPNVDLGNSTGHCILHGPGTAGGGGGGHPNKPCLETPWKFAGHTLIKRPICLNKKSRAYSEFTNLDFFEPAGLPVFKLYLIFRWHDSSLKLNGSWRKYRFLPEVLGNHIQENVLQLIGRKTWKKSLAKEILHRYQHLQVGVPSLNPKKMVKTDSL